MISIFERWGLPKELQADNGKPFGEPDRKNIPPLSLWLIGLGIQPIWIRPGQPTDNGTVERGQQTTKNWVDLKTIQNIEQLKNALKTVIYRQVFLYKVKRLGNITRIDKFPNLQQKNRVFDQSIFDMEKIYLFLGQMIFTRKVSKPGQISLFSRKISIGKKHAYQLLDIKFNPLTIKWEARDKKNQLIKVFETPFLNQHNIIQLKLVKER